MKKTLLWILGTVVLISIAWIIYFEDNQDKMSLQEVANENLDASRKTEIMDKTAENGSFANLKKELQTEAQEIMKELQTSFKLDLIKTIWGKCDENNAFYDTQTQSITMCDEMITYLSEFAAKDEKDPKIQKEITMNSILFFFLHELGHAYIHLYDLPITGREEDVADQIATYMILELKKDNSYDRIMDGAFTFYKYSEENPEINDDGLADVHSLDKQRFYNISCRLYGATQKKSIITDRGLPEERAEGCEDEYNLMKSSLDRLLKE